MYSDKPNRRILLTSLFIVVLSAGHSFAQSGNHTEGSGSSGKQLQTGATGGSHTGGSHGSSDDHNADEEGHTDEHTDDHEGGHGQDRAEGEEHETDHATGESGRGNGPRYRGGRADPAIGVSRARSLEDRVLRKKPD